MVDDDSLFGRRVVTEASRPSFKGLEAEGKWELALRKSCAVVNHHFLSSEHIPSLIVSHLIVTICWCSNEFRSKVSILIALWLAIWDLHSLIEKMVTSELKSCPGGMAAMGSNGGGGGGCPGRCTGGRGRWSSVDSNHLTHSYPVNFRERPWAPTIIAWTLMNTLPLTVYPAK